MLTKVHALYERLTRKLIESSLTISTMESCTSGLVASLISDIEGASGALKGGNITYCNEAKIRAGVSSKVIEDCGVYSIDTAREMAIAARKNLSTDIGVGITGTLGNIDENNSDSQVGEVYIAIDFKGNIMAHKITINAAEDRFNQKLMVAEIVGIKLLDFIK